MRASQLNQINESFALMAHAKKLFGLVLTIHGAVEQ